MNGVMKFVGLLYRCNNNNLTTFKQNQVHRNLHTKKNIILYVSKKMFLN